MARANDSDRDVYCSDPDDSDDFDSDDYSDEDGKSQVTRSEPCKFYNRGHCRDGRACAYPHVCRFFLEGNCRYGSKCRLSHSIGGDASSGAKRGSRSQSASHNPPLSDGRLYQWQINDGSSWKDIENDHILEAQFSLPHTKSIKIYNTPYGALNINFATIRVRGKKNIDIRRLDDGKTVWIWYCILKRKWVKYGDKDPKGNVGPMKSSDIEVAFQSNPAGSFSFDISGQRLEIKFKDMCQVGQSRSRKVTRRPQFRQQQAGGRLARIISPLKKLSLGSKPQWEFEGDRGTWHVFKPRAECSISTDDIERKYQQNPNDVITFKVKATTYQLDFGAMTQTNMSTKKRRNIRRVLV